MSLFSNIRYILVGSFIIASSAVSAEDVDSLSTDVNEKTIIHRIEMEALPSAILHTNAYLKGANDQGRTMNHAFMARLKYAFQHSHNDEGALYKNSYQGIGVAYNNFNPQLGNPVTAFIFQGARIKTFNKSLSLNYEWELGLTFGWNPYDKENNPENRVIGSKVTAYIDADVYFTYRLSRYADVNFGVDLVHYSNGDTKLPNCGLNVLGAKLGIAYYINRKNDKETLTHVVQPFHKHVSCDVVLFGAWRRQGFNTPDGPVVLPNKYGVFGININPMYNINHWFRAGISADGVYDRSANLYVKDYILRPGVDDNDLDHLAMPSASKQITLGLSARMEFVMPYFTINAGIGHNVINAIGVLNSWYQLLALKIGIARRTFVHIGYSLHDFKNPNHLLLGFGVRLW